MSLADFRFDADEIKIVPLGDLSKTKEQLWLEKYKDKVFISPSYGKGWWMESPNRRVKKGSEVGSLSDKNYIQTGGVFGKIYIHRIIWTLRHGEIPKGYFIHHKDGNTTNNRIDNLDILKKDCHSRLHNSGAKNGMYNKCGEKHPQHKLTWNQVCKIREEYKPKDISLNDLAKKYNISKKQVFNIIHCRQWRIV